MTMNDTEIRLLIDIVDRMEDDDLTDQEKIIFVLGIQSGMDTGTAAVRDQLDRVADICLSVDTEYEEISGIKDFDN